MKKYTANMKRVDYYDIGNGLKLMNILTKNKDGELERIVTFIGSEEAGFSRVGVVEELSQPGTLFSYQSYVRMIESNLDRYLQLYRRNTRHY